MEGLDTSVLFSCSGDFTYYVVDTRWSVITDQLLTQNLLSFSVELLDPVSNDSVACVCFSVLSASPK